MREILLGVLQGLTEFLPVSSSGHLVFFKHLLGLGEQDVTLEVMLHLATLLAILVFFWKRIPSYLKGKKIMLIILGSVPAGIVGVFFKDKIEALFTHQLLPLTFFTTAVFLLLSDRRRGEREIGIKEALFIGIAQAFAILPGISRSGFTIGTALLLGVNRDEAFEFSFFLSIPAVLGAGILEAKEIRGEFLPLPFLCAFLSGIFALWILRRAVLRRRLLFFSLYLFGLALLSLKF
ncbi:UDP-diphosphatase [bacterium]|nr:MAG: UDP-diphosphatase [bacterium]